MKPIFRIFSNIVYIVTCENKKKAGWKITYFKWSEVHFFDEILQKTSHHKYLGTYLWYLKVIWGEWVIRMQIVYKVVTNCSWIIHKFEFGNYWILLYEEILKLGYFWMNGQDLFFTRRFKIFMKILLVERRSRFSDERNFCIIFLANSRMKNCLWWGRKVNEMFSVFPKWAWNLRTFLKCCFNFFNQNSFKV